MFSYICFSKNNLNMKFKTICRVFILPVLIAILHSCKEKKEVQPEIAENKVETEQKVKDVRMFNLNNEGERAQYERLDLDASHPNLLDPKNSLDQHAEAIQSWSDLHQRIGGYLQEKGFDWGVEDSSISIIQKIYFKPDGQVHTYFYGVLNDKVSDEKRRNSGILFRNS